MSGTIKVDDFAKFTETENKLRELSESAKTYSTNLRNLKEGSSSVWRGEDADAFKTAVDPICDRLNNLSEKLSSCATALSTQHKNYTETITNNTTQVPKITG